MNRVQELRKKNGYSQQKLAKVLNVHQTAISQWETGRTSPDIEVATSMAQIFGVTLEYLLGFSDDADLQGHTTKKGVRIPVFGYVAAGIPIDAIEDVLDYEEIAEELAASGKFFALRIKGDSMAPHILDGDTVIVRQQEDVENGETAIVMVNGDEATCKRVIKQATGISLIANNPMYEPRVFSKREIMELPVRVLGKVVELRRSF